MDSHRNSKQFSEFLLREYDNIASAYFNIKNSISLFFRYYILIASVPISVFLFILNKKTDDQNHMLFHSADIFAMVCFLIALVGFGLMMYVLSMNFTATLYARQVNGIRYYYYNKTEDKIAFESKVRVLPLDNQKPDYSLLRSVKYLLLAFSSINAFYFTLGMQLLKDLSIETCLLQWFAAVVLQSILCFFRVAKKVSAN